MDASQINRLLRHTHWNRTDNINELPIFAQVVIISSIVIISILGAIPIFGFLYGCIRKERILREVEERRRERIEIFLLQANTIEVVNNLSPWQRALKNVPSDQVEEILSKLMFVFSWISSINHKTDDKAADEEVDDKAKISADSGNAAYCAICLSHFEDNDEVVQSMSFDIDGKSKHGNNIVDASEMNLCVHRFHKHCMVEWLVLSKEPNCPCCRREYLDRDKMMEEGIIVEKVDVGMEVGNDGEEE